MSITAPPALTPPPSPAPSRTDVVNFAVRSDAYHAWRVLNAPEEAAALTWSHQTALEVLSLAQATQSDRILSQAAAASVAAANPAENAASAAASAAAAAGYASTAQATNPDSPVRFNLRRIDADLTVPSTYNAASTGPIQVSDGVTVTISDNATWSIT